jgi:fumarylacetoacetase
MTDHTHDPALRSWVESANDAGADFPVQNLPLGTFRRVKTDETPRVGVAIGDQVLDLRLAATQCPWGHGVHDLLAPLAAGDLNAFMALGPRARRTLREALSYALRDGSEQAPFLELCLVPQSRVQMLLPCRIGEYTDFYTGIHHAAAVGKLFRPDAPLLPNYKWVPIGYHGRASTVGVGPHDVLRPWGQTLAGAAPPRFGPTQRLDYELELGVLVGTGNDRGRPMSMAQAEDAWFGLVLLNDWSARDVQAWEYQPLGPFLSKNFATTVSPWVVTREALDPFRRPFERPAGDPQPLPHLDSDDNRARGAVAVELQVLLHTASMRERGLPPAELGRSNSAEAAYWTIAQLLAHHTSGGCNLRPGDLLGTGTLSGPGPGQGGSLLELAAGGARPLSLPGGETRGFLEDGDTVILRAWCEADGARRIGFGECVATVRPASPA